MFWAFFASYGFLVVFLRGQGLNSIQIGTIFSVCAVIGVLANPFWGLVSDWLNSVKKVFIICTIISILLFSVLPVIDTVLLMGFLVIVLTFLEHLHNRW